MKRLLIIICVAALGCAALAADRDPVYSFTYQAALRDELGSVISNKGEIVRNHELVVRLWDNATGGNLLWGRHFTVYTDETGLFNLEVHDNGGALVADDGNPSCTTLENALSANAAGSVYIGIKVVGSDNEISPRQKMFAVPYAGVANEARKLRGDVTVDGTLTVVGGTGGVKITPDGIRQSANSSEFNNLKVNSAVNAGELEVEGASEFSGTATFKGSMSVGNKEAAFTVESKKFGVDDNGNTTVGGTLTVDGDAKVGGTLSAKSLEVGGAALMPVPLGGIIMWASTTPPAGDDVWATADNTAHWAICNGNDGKAINNIKIPDLHGRFIVGASNTGDDPSIQEEDKGRYSVGVNGGTNKVALTTEQMPVHSHLYVQDEGVSRYGCLNGRNAGSKVGTTDMKGGYGNKDEDNFVYETGTAGGDSTYGENGEGGKKGTVGYSTPHQNLPPYYALFYIIRVR